METDYVTQKTCDALHQSSERRIDRVEKDTEKQWATIDDLRKTIQKQAITIAMIVGGVTTIVQAIALAIQAGFKTH